MKIWIKIKNKWQKIKRIVEVLSITLVQSLFSPLTFSLQFFFLETLLKHKTFFFSYSLFFSFLEIAVLDFCETRFVIDLFIFCFSSFLMNKSFFFSNFSIRMCKLLVGKRTLFHLDIFLGFCIVLLISIIDLFEYCWSCLHTSLEQQFRLNIVRVHSML